MRAFFFWRILLFSLSSSYSLIALEISIDEAEIIGRQIYFNECSRKPERLVWWNDGEDFASMGIGHFIWYSADKRGPFEETFPSLLAFLQDNKEIFPEWLKNSPNCPWNSKEEYLNPQSTEKKKQLQELLSNSISLQAQFIAQRFEQVLPQLLENTDENQKIRITENMQRLGNSLQGKYALIDYLNFKGKGLLESERYQNEGWGLKQALEMMPDNAQDPLQAFIAAAKALLIRRVQNAPKDRREERWLPGWLARLDSYQSLYAEK